MSDPDLPPSSLRGDYQPITSGAPPDPGIEPRSLPSYALFSPKQIGVITFFGGPLAAGVTFWSNFKHLGQATKAVAALLIGAVATIGLCVLSMYLPESFPRMGVPLAYTLAIAQYAKASQTRPYEAHLAVQGKRASNWLGFGITIASLAVTLGVLFGVVYLQQPSMIEFGESQVIYTSGGTRLEAQQLGDELTHLGYFSPEQGATATVRKSAGRHVIEFVVKDSAFVDPAIADGFRELAPQFSKVVFRGEPVDLWLDDDHGRTKLRLMWQSPAESPAVTP